MWFQYIIYFKPLVVKQESIRYDVAGSEFFYPLFFIINVVVFLGKNIWPFYLYGRFWRSSAR